MKCFISIAAAIFSLQSAAVIAGAEPHSETGKIKRYECGDNCYLIMTTAKGRELTALCIAKICKTWNQNTVMPKKFIGKKIIAKMGTGEQLYGDGTVVGDFPAFVDIKFLRK